MKKSVIVFTAAIVLFLISIFFLFRCPLSTFRQSAFKRHQLKLKAWTDGLQLDYANILLAKGLKESAAEAFKVYIETSRDSKEELSDICYKLGNLYMELGQYELALRNFYKAELLTAHPAYEADRNQRIVEALENLGWSSQARYELGSRTQITPAIEAKAEKIAARLGKREITEAEIDAAIDRLPVQAQEEFRAQEGKLKFIRQYLAQEVLYEKAKRLGMDKDARLNMSLDDLKKGLILQSLIRREIEPDLKKITAADIELYYKANKDKYKDKTFEELKDKIESEYRFQKESELTGALLEKTLEQQEVEVLFNDVKK